MPCHFLKNIKQTLPGAGGEKPLIYGLKLIESRGLIPEVRDLQLVFFSSEATECLRSN